MRNWILKAIFRIVYGKPVWISENFAYDVADNRCIAGWQLKGTDGFTSARYEITSRIID